MESNSKLTFTDKMTIGLIFLAIILLVCTLSDKNSRLDYDGSLDLVRVTGEYSVDGGAFLKLTPETSIPLEGKLHHVVIRGHFDHGIAENRSIMLRITDLSVTMRINGVEVFTYGEMGTFPSLASSAGDVWRSFVSDGITTDDLIEIELDNFYVNNTTPVFDDFINSMYTGSEFVLFTQLRLSTIRETLFATFVILLGAMMLIVSFSASKYKLEFSKGTAYFGGLITAAGFFLLFEFDIIYYYFPYPFFNNTFSTLSIYFLFLFSQLSLTTVFESKFKLVAKAISLATVIFMSLCIVLQFLRLGDLFSLMTWGVYIEIATVLVCIVGLFYEAFKLKRKYVRSLLLSMYVLFAGGIVELINYFTNFLPFVFAFKVGLVLFILLRSVSMLTLINKNIRRLQDAKRMESELAQSRITIMLSQIKPHFIYNALNAISGLCLTDPIKADEAIVDFSDYLRANINSLQSNEPIRFEEELDHIKHYAALERLRFGERIKFDYNIGFSNFSMPTLTLQPVIENAVKHGLSGRPEGGRVKLTTRLVGKIVVIVVEDNGVGFNAKGIFDEVDSKASSDGHVSVGLKNVRSRLAYLGGAEIRIDSTIGIGTRVTITLPLMNGGDKPVSEGGNE